MSSDGTNVDSNWNVLYPKFIYSYVYYLLFLLY